MVLALVCLWVGFAAGLVCAALLAGRSRAQRADDASQRPVEPPAARPFGIVRIPVRKRRVREAVAQDQDR